MKLETAAHVYGKYGYQYASSRETDIGLIELKSELGSAVTTDLLLEEGNYLTDSANYISQELAFKNAISNLNYLFCGTVFSNRNVVNRNTKKQKYRF